MLTTPAAAFADKTPELSGVFAQDFRKLASCAYQSIENYEPTGLRKADLIDIGMIKISLEPSSMSFWQIEFKSQGSRTLVTFKPAHTIWGTDVSANAVKVWPTIQACAPGPG